MRYDDWYNTFVNSKYTYNTRELDSFRSDPYFQKALRNAIRDWLENKDTKVEWKYSSEISPPHNVKESELLQLLNTIE